MIQDIYPQIFDNTFKDVSPKQGDYIIIPGYSRILARIDVDGDIEFPRYEETTDMHLIFTYLFSVNKARFFMAEGENIVPNMLEHDFCEIKISFFNHIQPRWKFFAAETAYQLAVWYRHNMYCGACGKPMVKSTNERALHCSVCGNILYPQICPAVIVGIINKNKLLVTRYKGSTEDRFALIAGYAEIGETIEQTVRREVMEETGLQVKNIRYYKSQPWSFSNTLLFGFFCNLDGSDKIRVDTSELATAEWKTRDKITQVNDNISLTSEMIDYFKTNLF